MLKAAGAIGLQHEAPVAERVLEDLEEALLPGVVGLLAAQGLGSLARVNPIDEVEDVPEMVIEGLPIDLAVLGYVDDGDALQRPVLEQLLERGGEGLLRGLG